MSGGCNFVTRNFITFTYHPRKRLSGTGREGNVGMVKMAGQHVAELNIARLKHDIDDPRIADFVNNLDRVNAAAERSDGFIWRLELDATATDVVVMNDPHIIANMSVWRDIDSLERFVFQTIHKRIYARKAEWFDAMDKMHFVMWPVSIGHKPDLNEALARLEMLNTQGASDEAFGWDYAKSSGLWRTESCDSSAA